MYNKAMQVAMIVHNDQSACSKSLHKYKHVSSSPAVRFVCCYILPIAQYALYVLR